MDLNIHQKICAEAVKSWSTQHGEDPFSCHSLESVSLDMKNKKNKASFKDTMQLLLDEELVTSSGNGKKPYMVTIKQRVLLVEVLKESKTWLEEAAEAVDMYGHNFPAVNWELELKKCAVGKQRDVWMNWFRRARLPALLHDRFYIDGKNRKGDEKPHTPPFCGWEGTPVDVLN